MYGREKGGWNGGRTLQCSNAFDFGLAFLYSIHEDRATNALVPGGSIRSRGITARKKHTRGGASRLLCGQGNVDCCPLVCLQCSLFAAAAAAAIGSPQKIASSSLRLLAALACGWAAAQLMLPVLLALLLRPLSCGCVIGSLESTV